MILTLSSYLKKKNTQAASTWDTSLTTLEANLHIVPSDNQSKKKEKNKNEELWKWTKKVKITNQKESNLLLEVQLNLNDKPLCSSEWKKLNRYQGRTESISWNKLCYGNQQVTHDF